MHPSVYFTGENTIIVSQSTNNMAIFLNIIKVKLLMKSLKAIRIIKSLNCNLILCATEFLKHRKMGHTIIVVVKRLSKGLNE